MAGVDRPDEPSIRADTRVHAVESSWLQRLREARVVAYRLPEDSFVAHDEVGGYWVSADA